METVPTYPCYSSEPTCSDHGGCSTSGDLCCPTVCGSFCFNREHPRDFFPSVTLSVSQPSTVLKPATSSTRRLRIAGGRVSGSRPAASPPRALPAPPPLPPFPPPPYLNLSLNASSAFPLLNPGRPKQTCPAFDAVEPRTCSSALPQCTLNEDCSEAEGPQCCPTSCGDYCLDRNRALSFGPMRRTEWNMPQLWPAR